MSLNGYRGHFIDNVELNSRAEKAGLQHGDLVLEINGTPLLHQSHDDVVSIIKKLTNDPMQSRYYTRINYFTRFSLLKLVLEVVIFTNLHFSNF